METVEVWVVTKMKFRCRGRLGGRLARDLYCSSTVQQELFHTERAFIPYDQIHAFGHRTRAINQNQFKDFLQGIRIVGSEKRVEAMTVTFHQDGFPKNDILADVINLVHGRIVIRDGVRVHIVDGHHLYAVFEKVGRAPDPRYSLDDGEHRGVRYDASRQSTSFVCGSNEEQ